MTYGRGTSLLPDFAIRRPHVSGRSCGQPSAALPAIVLVLLLLAAGSSEGMPTVAPAAGQPPGSGWHPASFKVGATSPVLASTRMANGSTAYVAWIDRTRTRLALYPGTDEPVAASPRGLGDVPVGRNYSDSALSSENTVRRLHVPTVVGTRPPRSYSSRKVDRRQTDSPCSRACPNKNTPRLEICELACCC